MLDPRLFARRGFGVGSLSLTLQFFAQFGLLFVVLQYLQFVLGYSPLQAGLSMLPMALMLMVISPRAPRLAHRLGVRVVGGIGLALMGAGFLVFSTLGTDSSYWHFGIGALITGIGIALATAPATTAIVSSLPAERQGIASAVNDLTREVGGAFGIAVLGSLLNSATATTSPRQQPRSPRPLRAPRRTRSPPLSHRPQRRRARHRTAGTVTGSLRERLLHRAPVRRLRAPRSRRTGRDPGTAPRRDGGAGGGWPGAARHPSRLKAHAADRQKACGRALGDWPTLHNSEPGVAPQRSRSLRLQDRVDGPTCTASPVAAGFAQPSGS